MVSDKGFVEWEHEFSALVVEVAAMNPSTLFAVLQLFSVCFCHLRSLVIVIPRSLFLWTMMDNLLICSDLQFTHM